MRTSESRRPLSSVELLFDATTEAAVRAEWKALADRGMSSLAPHTSPTNRPHVTLLAQEDIPPLDARAFREHPSFEITLGAPVLFGDGERRVLARSIVSTPELLRIHAAVHAAAGGSDADPRTVPGTWTPHVTLARRLRAADVPAALDLIDGEIRGRAMSLRRWDPVAQSVTTLHAFS